MQWRFAVTITATATNEARKGDTYEWLFPLGSSGHEAVRPSAAGKPRTPTLLGWHASSW